MKSMFGLLEGSLLAHKPEEKIDPSTKITDKYIFNLNTDITKK